MSLSLVVFTTISIYVNANNPSIYNRTIAFINEINFIKNNHKYIYQSDAWLAPIVNSSVNLVSPS